MKRISIFSAFPPFRGGISHFSARLTNALEKENSVQTHTFKSQYPNWLFPGKSQFDFNQKSEFKSPAKRIVSTFSPFSYFALTSSLKKDNSSLFITNYWMTIFAPLMGFIARGLPKKTTKIAIVHNLIPHEKRFFDSFFNRYFIKSYDGFVALSQHVYNDLSRFVAKEKIILLPHPSYDQFGKKENKEEARQILKIDSSKKTLLFFGIIRHYKGLDLLIDAFGMLDDTYQLIIAGEIYGNDSALENQIKQNRNYERIHFRNEFIPDSEIKNYFSAADFLILPYRSGTQSGVASIAQTFDLPVIATNTGGIAENIELQNGTLIEAPNPQAIQKAILNAFNKEIKVIDSTQQAASSINSWDEFAQKLILFSDSIAK